MPSDIESPDDDRAAVQKLPDHQRPYGGDCPLSVEIQSIFFHYELDAEVVGQIVDQKFTRAKHFKMADPEGDDKQRALFSSIVGQIKAHLVRHFVTEAFSRLQLPDPMAALPPRAARYQKRAASGIDSAATDNQPAKKSRLSSAAVPQSSTPAEVPSPSTSINGQCFTPISCSALPSTQSSGGVLSSVSTSANSPVKPPEIAVRSEVDMALLDTSKITGEEISFDGNATAADINAVVGGTGAANVHASVSRTIMKSQEVCGKKITIKKTV